MSKHFLENKPAWKLEQIETLKTYNKNRSIKEKTVFFVVCKRDGRIYTYATFDFEEAWNDPEMISLDEWRDMRSRMAMSHHDLGLLSIINKSIVS